jgi:hypothetical protein
VISGLAQLSKFLTFFGGELVVCVAFEEFSLAIALLGIGLGLGDRFGHLKGLLDGGFRQVFLNGVTKQRQSLLWGHHIQVVPQTALQSGFASGDQHAAIRTPNPKRIGVAGVAHIIHHQQQAFVVEQGARMGRSRGRGGGFVAVVSQILNPTAEAGEDVGLLAQGRPQNAITSS